MVKFPMIDIFCPLPRVKTANQTPYKHFTNVRKALKMPPKYIDRDRIIKAYEQEGSLRKAGKISGYSASTVKKVLNAAGICTAQDPPLRSAQPPILASTAPTQDAQPIHPMQPLGNIRDININKYNNKYLNIKERKEEDTKKEDITVVEHSKNTQDYKESKHGEEGECNTQGILKPTYTQPDQFSHHRDRTQDHIQAIDSILGKMFKRLKKEQKDIKIGALPVAIGILVDKKRVLTEREAPQTLNQLIINLFGDNKKMLSDIQRIRSIKERSRALGDSGR
jgi:hypothetical protein